MEQMEGIGETGNARGTEQSTSAPPALSDENRQENENDVLAMESTVTQSNDRLACEPSSAVENVAREQSGATYESNTVSVVGDRQDTAEQAPTLENVERKEELIPEKVTETGAGDENALQMADTYDTDESRDDMIYSEDGAESDAPDDGGPPRLEASIERPTVAPPVEESTVMTEDGARTENSELSAFKTKPETLKGEDRVATSSGKTVREILLENASLKTQLANLMKEVDQRYRVTEELLQLTVAQRDKLNQFPVEDCRVVKIWNSKKKENADVYLSREASEMLKQGMAIVLRKKSLPSPLTVNRDVSDVDSDVGDVITSGKKSRRGRKVRRTPVVSEGDSESAEEKKPIRKIMNKNKPKDDSKRIDADAKAREAEIKRERALVRKQKNTERLMEQSQSAKTKAKVENGPLSNNSDTVNTSVKRRGRPKKSSVTEGGQEGQDSLLPKQRQLGFLAHRNKSSKLTNSKTAILPKIRSARIRARASTNSLTKSPVVKLSKVDVESYGKEQKKGKMTGRGKPDSHYSPEAERRLKELKRPTIPSPSLQFAAKRLQGLHPDSKVVGSTKRKTFTPIRKPVVKKDQKDYIREIKELTQRGKAKPESAGNADSMPVNAGSTDWLPDGRPRKLENSVLNIPLSPSKMKLLAARDVLKRKLTRVDERSSQEKRAKTTVIDPPPVPAPGSARTRGRVLVKEIRTTFPETDFIKKLEELDSRNRPRAKPVPDNESSAKLSRLIDSVAGRLVASPVSFSEESVESMDLKEGEIPTSVDEHNTKPPRGAFVPTFTHPPNPESGAALVGPMVPLGGPSRSPQVLDTNQAATFSGEFVISKHALGSTANADVKTGSDAAKEKVMVVRNSSEGRQTILVKMIPPARKGSGIDLHRSSGQFLMYANPSTAPSPSTENITSPSTENIISPGGGSSTNPSKNLQIRTIKASELMTWKLKNKLGTDRAVTEAGSSGSASSVSPSISILKSNTAPFLIESAPGVPEPEINRARINEHDLNFVDKNDDFYDQNYDSIQDILNLLDADASPASARDSIPEAGREAASQNEIHVDGDRALDAARAMVAMETEKSTAGKRTGARVGSQSSNAEIPSPDLLSELVHATLGGALDVNEEKIKSNNVAADGSNRTPAHNHVVAGNESKRPISENGRLKSNATDEVASDVCDDRGESESDVDMESVDDIVGEAPEIVPDSGDDEDDDDSVGAESVAAEGEEEEEGGEEEKGDEEEENEKEELGEEELRADSMDEAEHDDAEKCDDEVAGETNHDADLLEKEDGDDSSSRRSDSPIGGSIDRSDVEKESPERDDTPSGEGVANGRQSPIDDSIYESETESFRCIRDSLVAGSDSDDSIGGECVEEEPPLTTNSDEKTKTKNRKRRDSTRKSSNAEEISPRTAILSIRKQNKSNSLKMNRFNKGDQNVPSRARRVVMGRKRSVVSEPPPEDPPMEISSYQVVAIIRRGRDHYHRCPRQMEAGSGAAASPHQDEYSDFLMKIKDARRDDAGGSKCRRGAGRTARHPLLSIGGT